MERYGTKVILLPQAFGPSASPAIKAITIVADHADLIFLGKNFLSTSSRSGRRTGEHLHCPGFYKYFGRNCPGFLQPGKQQVLHRSQLSNDR